MGRKKYYLLSSIFILLVFLLVFSRPTVQAQSAVSSTITAQINSSADDVNQDGGTALDQNYGPTYATLWIGTGKTTDGSYTGLRFNNLNIPKGVSIVSSNLKFFLQSDAWIGTDFSITAEATGNAQTFSNANPPSVRKTTVNIANYNCTNEKSGDDNCRWSGNSWHTIANLSSVIQEIINRSDWQPGGSIALISKGTGSQWGRKFIVSFDGSAANAPKLDITYIPTSLIPSPTSVVSTVSPTSSASSPTAPVSPTSPASTVSPTGIAVTPTAPAGCPRKGEGDADCDGLVDGVDYSYWVNSQCTPDVSAGQTCGSYAADFDTDGDVDYHHYTTDDAGNPVENPGDYDIWFENRGT